MRTRRPWPIQTATLILAPVLALAPAPALGQGAKARKEVQRPAPPRVLVYEPGQPGGPPSVILDEADDLPPLKAPLLTVELVRDRPRGKEGVEPESISLQEKTVTVVPIKPGRADRATKRQTKKKPKP